MTNIVRQADTSAHAHLHQKLKLRNEFLIFRFYAPYFLSAWQLLLLSLTLPLLPTLVTTLSTLLCLSQPRVLSSTPKMMLVNCCF